MYPLAIMFTLIDICWVIASWMVRECEAKANHPIVHNKTYRNDAADETCRLFSDVAQSGSPDSKSSKIIMKTCRLDLLFGDDMKDRGTIKGLDSPLVEIPVS